MIVIKIILVNPQNGVYALINDFIGVPKYVLKSNFLRNGIYGQPLRSCKNIG